MHNKKRQLLGKVSAAALLAATLITTNASAQINDEIIVTARKSESSLQDTPLAITALGNAELEDAAFENIIEVSKAAPGLFIESINGTNARVDTSPRFRGITFDSNSPLQRTASIFIDGTLVTGEVNALSNQEIERVEIIKGPQSALFGRNTFSGAINYVTKAPSNEFGGEISLLAATRNEFRGSASIEGPILGDTLTGRITGSYDFDGGHYSNIAEPDQDMGEETTWALSAVTEFNPNDNFRMRLRGSYSRDRDGPAAIARVAGFTEHNFGGFALPGGGVTERAFRGTIRTPDESEIGTSATPAEYDRAVAATNGNATFLGFTFDDLDEGGLIRDTYRLGFDATYEFGNDMQFDILASYSEDEFFVFTDFDATPTFGFNTTGGRAVDDFSIEARLSGSALNDKLDWSVGGNYLDIDIMGTGGFFDGLLGFWFPGVFEDPTSTGAKTFGIFGTLDYQLSDEFTLILEGRYQEDEISDASLPGVSPGTFTKFLPRVLLQYEPSDATTLYANYSVGNLPGGFNPEVGELDAVQLAELDAENPGVTTTFREEKLENYELGWKQSMLDGQAAFNLAAFYMVRSDQIFSGFQLVTDTNPAPGSTNPFRTVAFTDNGATTNIKGFELDGTWNMSDHMTLQGSLAWVDAKIDSFPEGTNAGDFTAVFGPDANVQGQRAPRFPEWSGSLSGTYERPISGSFFGSDSSWYTRGDLFYTGEFYDENTNLAEAPAAVDVNLRTGIRRDNVRFELFVTNLFEEDAPTGANNIADTSSAVRFGSGFFDFSQESVHVVLRDKRQFGARIDYTF